jgi:site-specific recombinase XerD
MSGREPIVVCRECGREGKGRVHSQLCNACRARKMSKPRNCDSCGLFRRQVAKGLCAACYRVSRLHDGLCPGCNQVRPIEGKHQLCEACQRRSRVRAGTCTDCRRDFRRLYGPRCRQCQRRAANPTGQCQDCGEPGEIVAGRCKPCYEHFRRHGTGDCPACGQRFPIGANGLCRMCTNNRRAIHVRSNPTGKLMLAQLTMYGRARGWSPGVLTVARSSVRMVLAGSDVLGSPPWTSNAIKELLDTTASHRTNKALQRVIDFLTDEGLATSSTEATFELWLDTQFPDLRPQIAEELHVWTDRLLGRGARPRKPLQNETIRSYVWILTEPLAAWSNTYDSLREVTSEAIDEQINKFSGAKRGLAASAMRSLFKTLKMQRIIFANPTRHLSRQNIPTAAPIGLQPQDRSRLLASDLRPDEHLMVVLAGVHAMRTGQIVTLRIDDVNQTAGTITVANQPRALDSLTGQYLVAWLEYRRQRWPNTANPHVLVNHRTANTVAPVLTGYVGATFRKLGHTAHQLRVDRFLDEVHNGKADPLRFAQLFGVTAPTALHYCADATALDHHDDRLDTDRTCARAAPTCDTMRKFDQLAITKAPITVQ